MKICLEMLFFKLLCFVLYGEIAVSQLPEFSNMVLEFIKQRDWKDVTVIHSQDRTTRNLLYNLLTKTNGKSFIRSFPVIRTENLDEIKRKVNNLKSTKRRQFLCLWNENVLTYIENADKLLFTSRYDWFFVLNRNYSLEKLKTQIIQVPFYISSEVFVTEQNRTGGWILYEIWKTGPNASEILHNKIGEWSENLGLKIKSLPVKMFRRKDMRGYHMRVATREFPAFSSMLTNSTVQNLKSGYVIDIFHILQEQLNFTYSAIESVHGSLQPDGKTWSGIVGMLVRDEIDVAALPFAQSKLRATAMDFSIPLIILKIRLFTRRPELGATWVLYSLPFGTDIWICLPIFVIVSGFFLWGINALAIKYNCPHRKYSLGAAFWQIFAGLLQQTTEKEPFLSSGKLVMVTSSLCSLILYTCYSAMLVSILTTMQPTLPFSNFEDLRKLPDWQLGTVSNSALTDLLQFSPEGSAMRDAWENKVIKFPKTSLVSENRQGMKNVLSINKYAYLEAYESIEYLLQQMPLDKAMYIVNTGFDCSTIMPSLGIQKNSPFKEILNYYIALMTSRGEIHKLRSKWWPGISREPPSVYPSPGFKEAFTLFLTLGIGFVSSLVCLGLEKIFSVKNMAKNEKDDDPKNLKKF